MTNCKVQTAEPSVDPGHTAPGKFRGVQFPSQEETKKALLKEYNGNWHYRMSNLWFVALFFKVTIVFHKVSKILKY